jgi:hypothetical protein
LTISTISTISTTQNHFDYPKSFRLSKIISTLSKFYQKVEINFDHFDHPKKSKLFHFDFMYISHHVYFYNLFATNNDYLNTHHQNNANEYNNYLNLPPISGNMKIDTLTWWKAHQEEFPTLAKIAKDYLSIQGTSVPSEQLFSLAGHAIRKTRTRLHPETTRACLCLKNWVGNSLGLGNNNVGEINIDNDLVIEKDDNIDCLIYLDE